MPDHSLACRGQRGQSIIRLGKLTGVGIRLSLGVFIFLCVLDISSKDWRLASQDQAGCGYACRKSKKLLASDFWGRRFAVGFQISVRASKFPKRAHHARGRTHSQSPSQGYCHCAAGPAANASRIEPNERWSQRGLRRCSTPLLDFVTG